METDTVGVDYEEELAQLRIDAQHTEDELERSRIDFEHLRLEKELVEKRAERLERELQLVRQKEKKQDISAQWTPETDDTEIKFGKAPMEPRFTSGYVSMGSDPQEGVKRKRTLEKVPVETPARGIDPFVFKGGLDRVSRQRIT